MTSSRVPDVTVGLPVRNGGLQVVRSIEAICGQSHDRLVLVVSDNASTDETAAVCGNLAARDERIRFTRQPVDLGALANFRFVLEEASTPFFMWAAHDDWMESDALARCRAALLARPDASAAVPEVLIHAADGSTRAARGASPLEQPAAFRLARFLARPADNSRFYGLYRTEALKRSFPADLEDVPAADWLIMALSLCEGAHVAAPGARLHRAAAEPRRYVDQIARRAPSAVHRLLPTGSMTLDLMRRLPPTLKIAAAPALAVLAAHQAIRHRWVDLTLRRP